MKEFDYLAKNPETARVFNQAMTETTARAAEEILATVDFSPYRTIVDVGGGEGQLLRSILHAYPEANGIVFDLPDVLEAARRLIEPRASLSGARSWREASSTGSRQAEISTFSNTFSMPGTTNAASPF